MNTMHFIHVIDIPKSRKPRPTSNTDSQYLEVSVEVLSPSFTTRGPLNQWEMVDAGGGQMAEVSLFHDTT